MKKTVYIRFIWIVCLLGVIVSIFNAFSCSSTTHSGKYNVILISADTLRADRLNCYGYDKYPTSPNIDALAMEGVLFENCVVASPWTTPSHLSMLTSLYPSTHGVVTSFSELWQNLYSGKRYNFQKLNDERTTVAEVLKDHGYDTAAFTAGGPLEPVIGFDQGFDLYDTSMYKLDKENTGNMFQWIKNHSKQPFFLFWHTFEIHAPYLKADFLYDILPKEKAEPLQKLHAKLEEIPKRNVWPNGAYKLRNQQLLFLGIFDCLNKTVCEALYLGGVLSIDSWIGELVKVLRDMDIYDNTLIVFTADHGEEFSDHFEENFYNRHGETVYEEMIHAPLIMKLPGQSLAGSRVPVVANIMDVMPTVLDYLKVSPERNEMQGKSLMPFLEESHQNSDQITYIEALAFNHEMKGIRTDKYKYIMTIDEKTVAEKGRSYIPSELLNVELYDLKEDPAEKDNLLAQKYGKEYAAPAEMFEQLLRKHISGQTGSAAPVELDETTIEKFKSLGYL